MNKNLKILFIEICNYEDYPTGGQLSFAKNMLGAFGNDLKLVGSSSKKSEPIGKWFVKKIDGVEYEYFSVAQISKSAKRPIIPARLKSYYWVRKYRREIFENSNFDLIMIQTPEVLMGASQYFSKPTVFVLAGIENPLSISRYRIGRFLARFYDKIFFKYATNRFLYLAAADTNAIKEFIDRSKGSLSMADIIQFPTNYNGAFFKKMDKLECRKMLNLPLDQKIVITVGRLSAVKGWKFMIDSFIIFLNQNPNSIFVIVGDGEDENKVRHYIDENRLREKVLLAGKKGFKDLSILLGASDLFIMGSIKEGWSTTLTEAIACGLPCVVTQFSSAEDLVKESLNGFVLKERDESKFANQMSKALNINYKNTILAIESIKEMEISNLKESFYSKVSNWYLKQ